MESTTSGSSVGFPSLLTLVFITLKLTHVIAWSWWWVLSPLWIAGGIGLAVFLVLFLIAAIAVVVKDGK